ncbi:MAG: hypothetical protein VCA36_09370, partial [Opitutales bacterium]
EEGFDPSETLPLLAARALSGEEIRAGGEPWPSIELLASVMRLSETSLWSLKSFRVQLEGSLHSPWDQTWRLWAPALGGLAVKDEGDGVLTLSRPGEIDADIPETFSGLAVPGLGVVALNLPDPPRHTNPDNQKGSAEGSYGLILPGLEHRVPSVDSQEKSDFAQAGDLQVAGVSGKWVTANLRLRFDEEGFLFPEDEISTEAST